MNALDLLKAALRDRGFDGLFNEYGECACELNDLNPCGECYSHCIAGYKQPCDCGEDHDFHISATKSEGEQS